MEGIAEIWTTDKLAFTDEIRSSISRDGFLFNDPEHVGRQTDGTVHWQSLQNPITGLAQARCAFSVQGEVAISPAAAPFGSIEFAEDLPPAVLGEFVHNLVERARLTGCKKLRLVNYPHCYAPRQTHRLIYVLTKQGFDIAQNTPTFYVSVSQNPLTERIHAQERQRLRKSQRAGLGASHWTDPCISTVVRFIRDSRQQQGYPLSISTERLSRLLHQFPEQFPVFVVRDRQRIAAICVCVRVRHDILYTFLPASQVDYRSFSPMVMLINHMYQYSQHQGIDILDLGASLDANQQPKPSLSRFKQNMGAVTSPKLTFEIQL